MNVIELARQAGASPDGKLWLMYAEDLEHFATLIRNATLEEAADFVDRSAAHCHHDGLLQVVLKSNATAIRAQKIGEQK